MTKIIIILTVAVITGLLGNLIATVAGFDPWWADVIGKSLTISTSSAGMVAWGKTQLAA